MKKLYFFFKDLFETRERKLPFSNIMYDITKSDRQKNEPNITCLEMWTPRRRSLRHFCYRVHTNHKRTWQPEARTMQSESCNRILIYCRWNKSVTLNSFSFHFSLNFNSAVPRSGQLGDLLHGQMKLVINSTSRCLDETNKTVTS